jgi:alkylated DNA nucleotide flippase Atl1
MVKCIPRGRCAGYGALGAALRNPVSGLIVGRWMGRDVAGVPWWRVVAKDGSLPIHRRDPGLAKLQADHLRAEGVEIVEGKVDMAQYGWDPE